MEQIRFDKRNYRNHNDKNKATIRRSLEECGAGRSVVIDSEGELISGNGVYEQAQKLGLKTRVIETDGSELVVVKRTDLKTADDKRKRLALADNAASDAVEWNIDTLQEDFTVGELQDWGVKVGDDDELNKILDDANFESLNDAARKQTGMVQICFIMKQEFAEIINAYIKQFGKDSLILQIVELCQKQEAK